MDKSKYISHITEEEPLSKRSGDVQFLQATKKMKKKLINKMK